MILKQNYTNVKQNEIFNISKFVVTENFKHHKDEVCSDNYDTDIAAIYKEEMNYLSSSEIFAVKNDKGDILGTIRALRWDYISLLPIQKMFGVNPLECTNGNNINEIWHIGRFAIKKGVSDLRLLKKLMVHAIAPICAHKGNIAFAECDAKLLRVLTLMGIKAKIVGESIDYLGSETIPVSMSYDGLINFYHQNKYLVELEELDQEPKTSLLPSSLVFRD